MTYDHDSAIRGWHLFLSYHPSGANVAMADASVHFISEDIAFPTFCDLNAMADRASVALP